MPSLSANAAMKELDATRICSGSACLHRPADWPNVSAWGAALAPRLRSSLMITPLPGIGLDDIDTARRLALALCRILPCADQEVGPCSPLKFAATL
jgi:hypothetical protein